MSDRTSAERAFCDRYRLKRATGRACLRRVAGGRCLGQRETGCDGCQRGGSADGWDHVRTYRAEDGGYVVLTQPYDLNGEKLVKLIEAADRFDLEVTVLPEPGWWDERTVGVVITRSKGEPSWMRDATLRLLTEGSA
jgi:hypothetical protein